MNEREPAGGGAALAAAMGLPVFAHDLFIPRYFPMERGDWTLKIIGFQLMRGYWSGLCALPDMPILTRRDGEGRNLPWMSMSPLEIESQEIGVRAARGHTVIHGLGMGWAAAACALRPEVTRVTVVELDPAIIDLVRAQGVFDQLPAGAAAKIAVVRGDADEWTTDAPVDLLFPDIWRPLWAPDRRVQVRRMWENAGRPPAVYYFGQEVELADMIRKAGRPLDMDGLAWAVAETGLPLAGPERPDWLEIMRAIDRRLDGPRAASTPA